MRPCPISSIRALMRATVAAGKEFSASTRRAMAGRRSVMVVYANEWTSDATSGGGSGCPKCIGVSFYLQNAAHGWPMGPPALAVADYRWGSNRPRGAEQTAAKRLSAMD